MTNAEKINMLEEMLELENGTLKEETLLKDIAELDSMAKLSLIVLCDDEFDKQLTEEHIRSFITVKDVLDFMG